MRVLIDIGHPAHVHYFRNLTGKIISDGGSVLFTLREKEMALNLIQAYGFEYVSFGKPRQTLFWKALAQFTITLKLLRVARRFKPDVIVNSTHYSAFVAWLTRKPHISIEDTFNMEQVRLFIPFTSVVITGNYPHPDLKKQLRINAFQESLYLRSEYFRPDPDVLNSLGLKENDVFTLIRFVSWQASHDLGLHGLTIENKIKAVNTALSYGKVFITSEAELPPEIEKYRVTIPVEKIHHLLYYASLVFSESATMISEAALLGTPGVYIDNNGRYYTRFLSEKYGIVTNFKENPDDQARAIDTAKSLLRDKAKQTMPEMRQTIEKETCDYSGILYELVKKASFLGRSKSTPSALLETLPSEYDGMIVQ